MFIPVIVKVRNLILYNKVVLCFFVKVNFCCADVREKNKNITVSINSPCILCTDNGTTSFNPVLNKKRAHVSMLLFCGSGIIFSALP